MSLRVPHGRHGARALQAAARIFRPASRSAFSSALASALALAAALALPAAAAEPVAWPSPWAPGQTWQYRTELVQTQTREGEVDEQRITGTSTLRIARDEGRGEGGLLQVWNSAGSRVEAVRGDRGVADTLAAMMDDIDRIAAELRLDRAGRADGLRNLAEIRPQVRAAMDRVIDRTVETMIDAEHAQIADAERDMLRAMVRPMMAAEMDALIDGTSVEAMFVADLRDFNAYTGGAYAIGETARAADPLSMPISGQALPAERVYRAGRDPAQPEQARIDWTTTLDQDAADDAALWKLAAEIAGEPSLIGSTGRPMGLEFVEEGRIDWRPADGAILRMEIERSQRYGRDHQSTLRLVYTLIDGPAAPAADAQAGAGAGASR